MARPKSKAPARRYHISGQSVVTLNGRDYYLGPHDSPEALARYAALIAIYQENGLSLPDGFHLEDIEPRVASILAGSGITLTANQANEPIRIRHVAETFRLHVQDRYRNNAQELHRLGKLCDELIEFDGDTLAESYGPKKLQTQRERWIESGLSRKYINRLTNSVVRMYRYAVAQELVSESAWQRLKSLEPLRYGQTAAPEHAPVQPVPLEDVRATAKELSPVLRAMVRVQLATGMRPSELCAMTPGQIDRTSEVWIYRPTKHKTRHRGKTKAIPIVGDAKAAIVDLINRADDSPLFSPRESMSWLRAIQRAARKSKVQPSQMSRAKAKPAKQPGEAYTPSSYRQAIQRAARRAGVPHWHPYQLRHLAATHIRNLLGVEAAQAALGHSHAAMTEHYAKQSLDKAVKAAEVAPRLDD